MFISLSLILIVHLDNYAQDTLTIDWQKTVCSNGYIDYIYDIDLDDEGNIYTLGSFPRKADLLGEFVKVDSGTYFLTKQDSLGNKIFAKNLGGISSFTAGTMELDSEGNLILGLHFQYEFYLHGELLVKAQGWASIMLKLDPNLNFIWFKTYPSSSNTYINGLRLDKNDNAYLIVAFLGTLSFEGRDYSGGSGYAYLLVSLDQDGQPLWAKHCFSDYHVLIKSLNIREIHPDTSLIYLISETSGEYIYLDGLQFRKEDNSNLFINKFTAEGSLLSGKYFQKIRDIRGIKFWKGRIFIAGSYFQKFVFNNRVITPPNVSGLYIGELNEQEELINFEDLGVGKNRNLTGFILSEKYGFLLFGTFWSKITIQNQILDSGGQYRYNGFILSLNGKFELNDLRHVAGHSFGWRKLMTKGSSIIGAANYEGKNFFKNENINGSNEDILVFKTKDLKPLYKFYPYPYHPNRENKVCGLKVFPNPVVEKLAIVPAEGFKITELKIYDSMGKEVKIMQNLFLTKQVELDLSELNPGIYILSYLGTQNTRCYSQILKN